MRPGDHAIHTYRSEEEQTRVVLDAANWLPDGARLVYSGDREGLRRFAERAASASFDLGKAIQDGRIQVIDAAAVYQEDGDFEVGRMLRRIREFSEQSAENGYRMIVGVGDASWLAARPWEFAAFLRYEAAVHFLRLPTRMTYLCQYDARAFGGAQIESAMATHEKVLCHGELRRRFFMMSRLNDHSPLVF